MLEKVFDLDRGTAGTAQKNTYRENVGLESLGQWFHSIDLGDGRITSGVKSYEVLKDEFDHVFRDGVEDRTLLDIGSWDGAFVFEAERRGASRVLATDHFCWSGAGWGTKACFDYAHRTIGSRVESQDLDVYELDPKRLGTFDVVLFLGVLYHLEDPYGGLKRAAAMSHGRLIVETACTDEGGDSPMLRFYKRGELLEDTTNFFTPNVACVRSMLEDLGFERVDILEGSNQGRLIAYADRR